MGTSVEMTQPAGSAGEPCCNDQWEQAYLRFESPKQEVAKFRARLKKLGAESWPKESQIVDLFCGRGNGLVALEQLGFSNLEGADLSSTLLAQYNGPAKGYVCDCRKLPFEDTSKDVLIVQGGLHHLLHLPEDLEQVLAESARVLRADGRMVIVEPWTTPFLQGVHCLSRQELLCRMWPKLNAFATMVEHERETYEKWLGQPDVVLRLLESHFKAELRRIGFGKLMFVGRKP